MTVVILRIILVSSIARRRSWADGLVGHGDGALRTLISRQDASRAILPCRRSEPLPRERFSPLALWDMPADAEEVCS